MNDFSFEFLAVIFILVVLGFVEITFLGGWNYILRFFGFKPKINVKSDQYPAPVKPLIKIEIPEKNKVIKYNGRIELPDGKMNLLDENGLPCEIVEENEMEFLDKRSILDGKLDVIKIRINKNNIINMLETKIKAKNLQIAQLMRDYIDISKSYGSIRLAQKGQERAEIDKIWKGRRPRPIIKGSKNDYITEEEMME